MEYPWYAAWDLAFHMASFVEIDLILQKNNYCLFYEKVTCILTAKFRPTSGILATWIRLCILGQSGMYNKDKEQTEGDTVFLETAFQKLLINYTWWVNQKRQERNWSFEGGFLD
jgi:hypothetical protein